MVFIFPPVFFAFEKSELTVKTKVDSPAFLRRTVVQRRGTKAAAETKYTITKGYADNPSTQIAISSEPPSCSSAAAGLQISANLAPTDAFKLPLRHPTAATEPT